MLQAVRNSTCGEPRTAERGVVSALVVAVFLPLICVMLSITFELAHFFGIRDELQRIVDREAHDALVYGRSGEEIGEAVRARMAAVTGMASISEVRLERGQARSMVSASAEYTGAFFQFVNDFTGRERAVMPMLVRSQVRIQPAASLIVLDRRLLTGNDECNDEGLRAMQAFVDRVVDTWATLGNSNLSVAVSPGRREPVELLSAPEVDEVPRCRAPLESSSFDVSSVRGVAAPVVFDAMDFALHVGEHASAGVFAIPAEVRSVLAVVSRQAYEQGYSSAMYGVLNTYAQQFGVPIDVVTVVLDDTASIDVRPLVTGIRGAQYREVGASPSELRGIRLASAVVQTVSDRIVVEQ
jgi:hypothetical protein